MSEPDDATDADGFLSPGSPSANPPAAGSDYLPDAPLPGAPAERRGTHRRKPPRWVVPFLRALARTGVARAAAVDAGIDHSTAYQRRRAHADFALAWAEAKKARAAAKKRAQREELEALRQAAPPTSRRSPSPANAGEEMVVAGNQLKRASGERWGRRKQDAFLAELAATGNLRRACDAVGISKEAVRKRRRNDPVLDAACNAAIAECQARIPEYLAGATAATFDPDTLPDSEINPLPKVSIDQAIKMAQLWDLPGPAAGSAAQSELASDEEVRDALVKSLAAFGVRVRQADDAWEALKDSGADPHRLGQISQVLVAAKWGGGDSMTQSCPHCRQPLYLSFNGDGEA